MKLSLNSESAIALRELADSLPTAVQNVVESTHKVISVYQGVSDTLGEHRQSFYELLLLIKNAQEKSTEAIEYLPQKLYATADKIDAYVASTHNSQTGAKSHISVGNKDIPSYFRPSSQSQKWNTEYMPLVQANIRRSVAIYFSEYVSKEKLERCLQALSFMDQNELKKKYGSGFQRGTLGFNDGDTSNIAYDITAMTYNGRVGEKTISESGNININLAFVTTVHENLHMMSANDTSDEIRRGIIVGGDESSRAMNEAFTEYFTFLSCGGETPLGGLYPGVYSGYQILMQEMPTIEKAVGRDCMMDAYFNNNPQRIRSEIDRLLGNCAWDDMCTASYDLLYNNNKNEAATRLLEYFKRLSGA